MSQVYSWDARTPVVGKHISVLLAVATALNLLSPVTSDGARQVTLIAALSFGTADNITGAKINHPMKQYLELLKFIFR